jgi:hypothetical protein
VAGHSIGTAVIALRSRPNTRVTAVKVASPETEFQAGPRPTDGDLQSRFDPAPPPHGRVSREAIKSTLGTDIRVARFGPSTPKRASRPFDASVDPTEARKSDTGFQDRVSVPHRFRKTKIPRVPIAVPAAAHTPAARLVTGQREARPRAEIRRQVGCLGQDLRRGLKCGSHGTHPNSSPREKRLSSPIPKCRPGIAALKRAAAAQ